jgi:hypothetical protein
MIWNHQHFNRTDGIGSQRVGHFDLKFPVCHKFYRSPFQFFTSSHLIWNTYPIMTFPKGLHWWIFFLLTRREIFEYLPVVQRFSIYQGFTVWAQIYKDTVVNSLIIFFETIQSKLIKENNLHFVFFFSFFYYFKFCTTCLHISSFLPVIFTFKTESSYVGSYLLENK